MYYNDNNNNNNNNLWFLLYYTFSLLKYLCFCMYVRALDVSAITLYSYSFSFGDLKPQAASERNPWVYKYFLMHSRKLFIMNLI